MPSNNSGEAAAIPRPSLPAIGWPPTKAGPPSGRTSGSTDRTIEIAKGHGAEYYDWRTIPDVLKPGEELYGVYEFKRGFGGFERRVLPTQDLVLRPLVYWPYNVAVTLRRKQQKWQRSRFEKRRQRDGLEANPSGSS